LAVAIRDKGYHPRIPNFLPGWLQTILEGCWEWNPENRISLDAIIQLTGVSDVEDVGQALLLDLRRRRKLAIKAGDTEKELEVMEEEIEAMRAVIKTLDSQNADLSMDLTKYNEVPPQLGFVTMPEVTNTTNRTNRTTTTTKKRKQNVKVH